MTDQPISMRRAIGRVMEPMQRLRLGQCTGLEVGDKARFTIVMNRAASATPTRLAKLAQIAEENGFRVVESSIRDATLRVDCVRSMRTIGVVDRIARDDNRTILTLLNYAQAKVWTIVDATLVDRNIMLLTRTGDEVELWVDFVVGEPGRMVHDFRNKTMPKLG